MDRCFSILGRWSENAVFNTGMLTTSALMHENSPGNVVQNQCKLTSSMLACGAIMIDLYSDTCTAVTVPVLHVNAPIKV